MKMCRLGDVANVQSGFAFKSAEFKREGVKLLRNTNILPQRIYWDDLACLDPVQCNRYSAYQLRHGDLLLSLDRPIISTGIKVARVGENDVPSFLVQRVGRFRLDESRIDPEYLYAYLRSPGFAAEISGHEQSLGVPHVSPGQVEAVVVPLPELTEQRRIAARLKAQLAEVDTARQAAQAQLREVARLADSIVLDSVRQHSTHRHDLGSVLNEIKQGIGAAWAEYPVLGATRDGLAPAKEPPGKHATKYKPAFSGTVFYNPMRILIGSIAFVDDDDTPGHHQPRLCGVARSAR
jgi:type I restriction enzyme S subunit